MINIYFVNSPWKTGTQPKAINEIVELSKADCYSAKKQISLVKEWKTRI